MKYFIIAGEPSGDLHGANLMRQILRLDASAEFQYWGGDHMTSVADGLVLHVKETAIMGFVEVVKNISKIKKFFKITKAAILDFNPDKIILIDYPGFNLRIAKWAKEQDFHITYYISPQLWAWKKGRIKTVKQYVDHMICILPFEKEFYASHGVDVDYVGHPLLPVIDSFRTKEKRQIPSPLKGKKILALLPGSRAQEVSKMLALYLNAAKKYQTEYHIVVAAAPHLGRDIYTDLIDDDQITILYNDTYSLLSIADIAIVTSGTATLEAALFGVPQVVCYRTSTINYEIGKRLVDLEHISLVNLIMDKQIVIELVQNDVTVSQLQGAIEYTIANQKGIKNQYKMLHRVLHEEKDASVLTAEIIVRGSAQN